MPPLHNKALPDFAPQWMAQWKRASVELARVRDQELREMGQGNSLNQVQIPPIQPPLNGLVIQQRWFMRQRLLETATKP